MPLPPVPQKYLISKYLDPLFALCIGLTSTTLRLRAEETEKTLGLPSSSPVTSAAQRAAADEARMRYRDGLNNATATSTSTGGDGPRRGGRIIPNATDSGDDRRSLGMWGKKWHREEVLRERGERHVGVGEIWATAWRRLRWDLGVGWEEFWERREEARLRREGGGGWLGGLGRRREEKRGGG